MHSLLDLPCLSATLQAQHLSNAGTYEDCVYHIGCHGNDIFIFFLFAHTHTHARTHAHTHTHTCTHAHTHTHTHAVNMQPQYAACLATFQDPTHRLMFGHFLRSETGRGDTIDRLTSHTHIVLIRYMDKTSSDTNMLGNCSSLPHGNFCVSLSSG